MGTGPAGKAGNEAELNKRSLSAQIAAGNAYLAADQPNDAFVVFKRAVELNSNSYDAQLGLALACAELKITNPGLNAVEMAHSLQPELPEPLLAAGRMCLAAGRLGQAARYLREALALDDTLVDAWKTLGFVRVKEGSLPAAATALEKARDLAPDDAKATGELGWVYAAQGRLDEAITQYRKSSQLDAQNPIYLTSLAWLLLKEGENLDEARAAARRADTIERGDGEALVAAAAVLLEQGHVDDAISELSACAIEKCPRNGDAHAWLADALLRRARIEDLENVVVALAKAQQYPRLHASDERLVEIETALREKVTALRGE